MGIADPENLPVQLVQELHGDMLGQWLPFAIADIYAVALAYATNGKQRLTRVDILESWGFDLKAEIERNREHETNKALADWFN